MCDRDISVVRRQLVNCAGVREILSWLPSYHSQALTCLEEKNDHGRNLCSPLKESLHELYFKRAHLFTLTSFADCTSVILVFVSLPESQQTLPPGDVR